MSKTQWNHTAANLLAQERKTQAGRVIRKRKIERAGTCQQETVRQGFKTEFYAMLGFSKEMTESLLVKKEALKCSGKIYSGQHRGNFDIKDDILRVENDPDDESRLNLTINRKPIADWFREQWHRLRYGTRLSQQEEKKNRGIKL